jgi:acetyl-CoA synthetase
MFPRLYFTGDGCKRNEDGFYRITGRVDDVINVSGHRIGTGEVEDAVGSHPNIVECAVVGFHHEIKGQALYIFAVCIDAPMQVAALKKEVETLITTKIGIFARPDKIQIVTNLPKTRSGKIVRRLLRKIAEDDISNLGDISTLVDADIISEIIAGKMSV